MISVAIPNIRRMKKEGGRLWQIANTPLILPQVAYRSLPLTFKRSISRLLLVTCKLCKHNFCMAQQFTKWSRLC